MPPLERLDDYRIIREIGQGGMGVVYETERAAWLRRILTDNLADALRGLSRATRDANRECSLHAALEGSSARLEAWLAVAQSSPSERLERHDLALRLADALTQLPAAPREAIILQHWQGLTLVEIGKQMEKSPVAAAGLLKRGPRRLRALLQDDG